MDVPDTFHLTPDFFKGRNNRDVRDRNNDRPPYRDRDRFGGPPPPHYGDHGPPYRDDGGRGDFRGGPPPGKIKMP